VNADVENIIQGDLSRAAVHFYFFANTLSRNGYHTALEWFEPGGRYVIFLREDGGVLRAMGDVAGLNIRIWSGWHDHIPSLQARPSEDRTGAAIAEVALSPSTDVEPGFAANIERVYGEVAQFAPASEVALLLRGLLYHEPAEVREQACLTLSMSFRYRDPCLPDLLHSANETTQQQAATRLLMRSSTGALVQALREAPFSLSNSGQVGDLPGDLELFTSDSDPAVRKSACAALARLFPSRQFPNCGSAAADK
jgi:hypothetical protein